MIMTIAQSPVPCRLYSIIFQGQVTHREWPEILQHLFRQNCFPLLPVLIQTKWCYLQIMWELYFQIIILVFLIARRFLTRIDTCNHAFIFAACTYGGKALDWYIFLAQKCMVYRQNISFLYRKPAAHGL